MQQLLDDLNEPQRTAVTFGEGPLLVLAGAGSGKTRVLTYRIAYLVAAGVARPHHITAVTFTNKAAREMRDRVERLSGGPLPGGFVGTFHRWALQLLRRHPERVGLPAGFAIADSDDQRALVGQVERELGLDPRQLPPRAVLGSISRWVNGRSPGSALDPTIDRIRRRYDELKRRSGVVDFDDMLVLAVELLRDHGDVRDAIRRETRWLLVDEFQDTNRLQMDLLAAALGGARCITAVGDEDQAIYRWRGAEMANILDFERHFPAARVVMLEQNYRSTEPILEVAGGLIARNQMRRGKRLFTSRSGGEPVRLYVGEDERTEARWTADRLEELARRHRFSDMAVLVRTNAQTRPFEEELTRRRVPYQVIGGLRFWQREEVRHAVAYLRLIDRPDDELAFRRVVNVPARGIGAATMDLLERHAAATGVALPAAARQLPDSLSRRARVALEGFFRLLEEAAEQRRTLDPGDLVGWLLETSGLLVMYDGDDEDRVARRENLAQLAAAVAEADAQGQQLSEFLDSVALLTDGDQASAADSVSLMTLHAAKGLEFEVVVLAGLEDGLLPHANSRDDPESLEEERRLAYVGMTRARSWLAVCAARTRFLFGQRQLSRPSRFLAELRHDLVLDVSDAAFGTGAAVSERTAAARRDVRPGRTAAGPPGAPRAVGSSRVRATVTDADGVGWRPGNRVRHRSFGDGVVLKCEGRGGNLKLVVYFDRAGRKTLVPTVARLEKI